MQRSFAAMRALLIATALIAAPPAFADTQTLADLSWIEGCWRTPAPREAESGAQITEVWIRPPMPALLGYSYTIGEGETQGWEQTRIEAIDGVPHFVAMPNGGPPVRFRLSDGDEANYARFENPEHDYPQRVEYRRTGNRLSAAISRMDGSNQYTFEYRRISCSTARRP